MAFSLIRLFQNNYAASSVMFLNFTRPYSRSHGYSSRRPSKVRVPYPASELQKEEIINLDPNIFRNSEELEGNKGQKLAAPKEVKKSNLRTKPEEYKKQKVFSENQPRNILRNEKISIVNKKHKVDKIKDVLEKQPLNLMKDVTEDHLGNVHEKVKEKKIVPLKLFTKPKEKNDVFDKNGDLIYEKLKDEDTRVTILITRAKSKQIRSKSNQVLVEGWRLIAEGLLAGCKLDVVLFSRKTDLLNLRPFLPKTGPKLYKMPYKEIQMWSNVETSPGIMGIFQTPDLSDHIKSEKSFLPLNIICDNIRDPGNLGSILRTALAVGCKEVILTKGCVDLWDPKVVRSAGGAHFRLNIRPNMLWSECESLIKEESLVCVADNKVGMPEVEIKMLSESNNLSYDNRLSQRDSILNEDIVDVIDETKSESIVPSNNKMEMIHIPITPYYEVDFKSFESVTLVIGGETYGISDECYLFVDKFRGMRVNIPMQDDVNSLNSGMALAIITFEIRKQIKSQIYDKFLNAVHS